MHLLLLIATLTLPRPASGCWTRGAAADAAQRSSPLDSASVQVGGATVKVCYGRPSARGRKVMGELVPFDRPWRLGANEATSIELPFAAELAGVRVPAGTYSLYAIPGASSWQVVVNRGVERWGIPLNDDVRAKDVGAGRVTTEAVATPVETLTLSFAPATANATELVVEWEKTRVRIPIRRTSG
jgi:hypothetical protein